MAQYEITDAEVLNAPGRINGQQLTLSILKEKGAPVAGLLWLEADFSHGEWRCWRDDHGLKTIYEVGSK